jgi:hypothetical protein
MENTYTYTARSADNPDEVVTFTLHDHGMSVGVSAPLGNVDRALQARGSADTEEGPSDHIQPLLKPVAVSALERATHPFKVADVDASEEDGGLQVAAWVRAGGLRLAPVIFSMDHVDNADAARAFVKELDARKESVRRPGPFPGPLDYWATWFAAGLSMIVALAVWLRKRYTESAA